MTKTILYIAQSIDGFIATKDGSTEWLHHQRLLLQGEDYGYQAHFDALGSVVQGFNTYKVIADLGIENPYAGKKNFVITRKQDLPELEGITFTNESPVELVTTLKQKETKPIWIIGGGQINAQLLAAGLIDKIIISIAPVFLGEGIPLFNQGEFEKWMTVKETKTFSNGMIQLVMTPNS
ncbi:dihydrofolate reductase family protein [Jiulongibacter sp. NS-SX5]|uniref:dihydrofolate reductase family protein n=1 Tax=Jiulongibacter sp. NS-SX5 TaxID=3463854 RepID=UPI004059EDD1